VAYYDRRKMTKQDLDPWQARARQMLDLIPGHIDGILDFGAGTGGLVRALRDAGHRADGVEPSSAGRALALEMYGVDLLPALPRQPGTRYSAVTALHVLEHVRHPIRELVAIRSVLTPGGTLVVEVPHAGSADCWIPSRRRAILDLPAHIHHFTPRTLRLTLLRAGFTVREVRLFNSALVEKALALRAGSTPSRGGRPHPRSRPTGVRRRRLAGPTVLRLVWRGILSASRSALPGAHFRVVASPAAAPGGAPVSSPPPP
jgi:SAM-dependent methyltransferase